MGIENVLNKIVEELNDIPGVIGIVLGGSRARGNNLENSDIDIGIYYDEYLGFNTEDLSVAATKLDDEHREKFSYTNRRLGTLGKCRWLVNS